MTTYRGSQGRPTVGPILGVRERVSFWGSSSRWLYHNNREMIRLLSFSGRDEGERGILSRGAKGLLFVLGGEALEYVPPRCREGEGS